jgi:hypothetical protein
VNIAHCNLFFPTHEGLFSHTTMNVIGLDTESSRLLLKLVRRAMRVNSMNPYMWLHIIDAMEALGGRERQKETSSDK